MNEHSETGFPSHERQKKYWAPLFSELTILTSFLGVILTFLWWRSLSYTFTDVAFEYIGFLAFMSAYPGIHVLFLQNRFLAIPVSVLVVEYLMIGIGLAGELALFFVPLVLGIASVLSARRPPNQQSAS